MIPINIIFKVIKNNPDDQSIEIKMCRQNSPKPIDGLYNFQESLRDIVSDRALMYFLEEPIISENESSNEIESLDLDDLVDKVISVPYGPNNELNEIQL